MNSTLKPAAAAGGGHSTHAHDLTPSLRHLASRRREASSGSRRRASKKGNSRGRGRRGGRVGAWLRSGSQEMRTGLLRCSPDLLSGQLGRREHRHPCETPEQTFPCRSGAFPAPSPIPAAVCQREMRRQAAAARRPAPRGR